MQLGRPLNEAHPHEANYQGNSYQMCPNSDAHIYCDFQLLWFTGYYTKLYVL